MNRLSIAPVLAVFAAGAFSSLSSGQAVNPGPASEQDVVKLSPFEVSSEAERGYATTSSASASRIAVAITDDPSSVITINSKLIEDTVAVDMRDTLNLISGVHHGNAGTGLQENNTFAIRGYLASSALRDGIPDLNFTESGGFDYSMVERLEVVKGPAGVLYGQHNAGGVLNFISKRPLANPMTRVSLTAGSFDFWRASVDHSSFLDAGRKLGYRISAAATDTDGALRLGGEPGGVSTWINPSVSYQFDSGLKVWAWGAHVDDTSQRVAHAVWMFGTPDGRGRPFYEFVENGKASVVFQNFNKTESTNLELGASHSFPIFKAAADLRVVARYGDQTTSSARTRSNGNTVFIDKAGHQIPDGTPNVGRAPHIYDTISGNLSRFGRAGLRYNRGESHSEDASLSADLNLSFDLGPTSHDVLFYAQYVDQQGGGRDNADIRVDNVATLPADIREKYRFDSGIPGVGITEIWPNPPAGVGDLRPIIVQYANVSVLNPDTSSDFNSFAAAVMERMSLFDDRLILVAGTRYDSTDFQNRRLDTGALTADESDSEWVSKFGVVYKPYSGPKGDVSLFYNRAETFVTETRTDQRLATFGQKFPNRSITTDEIGVKANLFRQRLVGTFSYFENTEDNILLNGRDEDGSITGVGDRPYLYPGGERTTDGWEVDLSFNVTPELDIILSYSRIDSLLSDGLPSEGVPESTRGAVVRYEFRRGPLKNFSITGIYTAWGESHLERGSAFIVPKGDLYTAVLGYRWRNLDLRFRIENLDDDLDAQPSTWWTGVGVTQPRNYRLSATYRF